MSVWLCEAHASQEFQTRRGGRDFVRTLMGVWRANACLIVARSRALDAHIERLTGPPPRRPRPGSYTWPGLRRSLEARYAAGATPAQVAATMHRHQPDCPAVPPSRRTIQRWHHQRRWISAPANAP